MIQCRVSFARRREEDSLAGGARVATIGVAIMLGIGGCGGGAPFARTATTVTTARSGAAQAAQPAGFAAARTRSSVTATPHYLCHVTAVEQVVDQLLGGDASCKQHPGTGLRPDIGRGYTTEWGPLPAIPEDGVTPREASVSYEHYLGGIYKKLGLTNPASYPGRHMRVEDVSCILGETLKVFVCLPGGPWSITMILTPVPATVGEYEQLARAVISLQR
jgi:hypothetical protein